MTAFLVKSDPDTYGISELERDGKTVWDGVKNPVAQRNIRTMKRGDDVLVYHTGDEKAVVGLARAASDAYPDPKNKRLYVVELQFVRRASTPLTLTDMRKEPAYEDLPVVRAPRLSVMPLPEAAFVSMKRSAGL